MLEPGGWPGIDDHTLYDRAQEYTRVLRQVTDVLETCQHQRGEIFDGGIWSGGAASAANAELETNIGALITLQNGLATVITWHEYIALSIVQAKSDIADNVEAAHHQINVLEIDSSLDAAERTSAIDSVVVATYGANVSVMEGTAERILASKAWKPPANALQDLLDQKVPPPLTLPDGSPRTPPTPVEQDRPRPGPPHSQNQGAGEHESREQLLGEFAAFAEAHRRIGHRSDDRPPGPLVAVRTGVLPGNEVEQFVVIDGPVGTCRQLARRARLKSTAVQPKPNPLAPAEHQLVTEKFITAGANDDIANLLRYLWPDVTLVSGPAGHPVLLAFSERRLFAAIVLTIRGDRVTKIEAIADPSARGTGTA